MRVQYIGEAMTESGLLFGSHVMDSTLGRISEDVIENGYYITRGRPHEGIRLSYLPRDDGDLEYTGLDQKIKVFNNWDVVIPHQDYTTNTANSNIQVEIFNAETQSFVIDSGVVPSAGGAQAYFRRADQLIG
jgi:hypothetical protein